MGLNKKPTTKSTFSSAEEAFHAEGPIGRVPSREFEARLRDDDVRKTLADARERWRRVKSRDPLDQRVS